MKGTEREEVFRAWGRYAPHKKKAVIAEFLDRCEYVYSQESFLKFIQEKLALDNNGSKKRT